MSPTAYRVLRAIERDTRRYATAVGLPPLPLSDFHRPLEARERRAGTAAGEEQLSLAS